MLQIIAAAVTSVTKVQILLQVGNSAAYVTSGFHSSEALELQLLAEMTDCLRLLSWLKRKSSPP